MSLAASRLTSAALTFTLALSSAGALLAACGDDTGTGGAGAGPIGGGGSGGQTTNGSGGTGGTGAGPIGGGGAGVGGEGGTGGGPCVVSLPVITVAPPTLAETGLYANPGSTTLASYIRTFEPKYKLWSDGADKQRFAYLPECGAQIDSSDMDSWEVPVGARFWKEFKRDGVLVETRFYIRTGPSKNDYTFATYEWDGNGNANRVAGPVTDVLGTGHDIPNEGQCQVCHKPSWRVLGFSAIQLSHNLPGETIASLSSEGLLTNPLPGGVTVPGDATSEPALGYLHANCGNCHNEFAGSAPVTLRTRLRSTDATVDATDTYTTAINVPTTNFPCGAGNVAGGCDRVEPGDPAGSAVHLRMGSRALAAQMPPIATELVDDAGLAAIDAWISALPP